MAPDDSISISTIAASAEDWNLGVRLYQEDRNRDGELTVEDLIPYDGREIAEDYWDRIQMSAYAKDLQGLNNLFGTMKFIRNDRIRSILAPTYHSRKAFSEERKEEFKREFRRALVKTGFPLSKSQCSSIGCLDFYLENIFPDGVNDIDYLIPLIISKVLKGASYRNRFAHTYQREGPFEPMRIIRGAVLYDAQLRYAIENSHEDHMPSYITELEEKYGIDIRFNVGKSDILSEENAAILDSVLERVRREIPSEDFALLETLVIEKTYHNRRGGGTIKEGDIGKIRLN